MSLMNAVNIFKRITKILWWSRQVSAVSAVEKRAAGRKNDSNNNKPNQNHDGAAMHTAAAVEESIAINWNQQSALHWHSHAHGRQQTCVRHAWLVTAHVVSKEDGSNCPAKYTSWPCLAPSCSSSVAAMIAEWQQWHHHGIPAASLQHLWSIPAASMQHQNGSKKHQNDSYSNCHVQWSYPPHHNRPWHDKACK